MARYRIGMVQRVVEETTVEVEANSREEAEKKALTLAADGGKRPFGNSGWQSDVYIALVRGGLIEGSVDDECDLDVDHGVAEKAVLSAIAAL